MADAIVVGAGIQGVSIAYHLAQRGMKVIMVTSPSAGEGKSTTAANLAVGLAEAGKRVLLLSADLRNPRRPEADTDDRLAAALERETGG